MCLKLKPLHQRLCALQRLHLIVQWNCRGALHRTLVQRRSLLSRVHTRKSKNKADVSARQCLDGKYIWFASSVSVAISICKVTNVQVSHTEATVSARAHFAVTPPYHAATSPRKDASCCCSTSQPARGSAIVCELNIEEYSGYERESTLDGNPRVIIIGKCCRIRKASTLLHGDVVGSAQRTGISKFRDSN